MSELNSGPGWYEVVHPSKATTHIVYVHEDGSIYFPEGEQLLDRHEFVHRLVRLDSDVIREIKAEAESRGHAMGTKEALAAISQGDHQ